MIILKEVMEIINTSVSDIPPETGGIIGSSHGEIIDRVVMDDFDFSVKKVCSYTPNVVFFNNEIEKWQHCGVTFRGIFHSHFAGVSTLSCEDKHYINVIMNAMPKTVKYLFFPVFVLPERRIVGYRAERTGNVTRIIPEAVNMQD